MELIEYELTISTGETIRISELDPDRIPDGDVKTWITSNPQALSRCTKVSRAGIEAAKRGDDSALKIAMMGPPEAMMIKLGRRKCSERKYCLSWDPSSCTSEGKKLNRKVELLRCWSYGGEEPGENEAMNAIVRAWSEGRHVVLVF